MTVITLLLLRVVMYLLKVSDVPFLSSIFALYLNIISCDSHVLNVLSPRIIMLSVCIPIMPSGPFLVTMRHGLYVDVTIPSFSL